MDRLTNLPTEILLRIGAACKSQRDLSALLVASRRLHRIFTTLLYDRDQRQDDCSALFWAARHGRAATIRRAAEVGVSIHVPRLLHAAVKFKDITVLRAILAEAPPAYINRGGLPTKRSPLIEACGYSHLDSARELLNHGADVGIAVNKVTAISAAVEKGCYEITSLLLDFGADVSQLGKRKLVPLHEAAWRGYYELVQLLLDRGADPNALDMDRQTPLHYSVFAARADITELLLASGADRAARTRHGDTAECLARRNQQQNVLRVLLKSRDVPDEEIQRIWDDIVQQDLANRAGLANFIEGLANGTETLPSADDFVL
ncbi:hypothetical protein NLG97_g3616 [Lecanicillium saksenae]|uniref:Uncharacterized protein n=1 Tax=Lecanicillium saksenae TaxID=468837 RepID=A0ACC1QXK3_9HYPO|nr:hypothetical protein NLG97_g3616 [Lecanicillium saksenae]